MRCAICRNTELIRTGICYECEYDLWRIGNRATKHGRGEALTKIYVRYNSGGFDVISVGWTDSERKEMVAPVALSKEYGPDENQ